MKILGAATAAFLAMSSSAIAGAVDWGFKAVPGVADGAKEYLWTDGGISIVDTMDLLTVQIWGVENLTGMFEGWVVDFAQPMDVRGTFDIYINPDFNGCDILVNPIGTNWDFTNQPFKWNEATGSNGGFCSVGDSGVTLTADLSPVPVPAGALLLLTGVAGFGLARRK